MLETLMLNHKQEPRVVRYAIYDFTDISPSIFAKAKEEFDAQRDGMRFETLDIEEDPIQQGFDKGTYDLIVAGNMSFNITCYRLLVLHVLLGSPRN